MAYYVYYPKIQSGLPAHLELVSADEKELHKARYGLIGEAIRQWDQDQMTTAEIDELWNSDSALLPAGLLSRLENGMDSPVVDFETGLTMHARADLEDFKTEVFRVNNDGLPIMTDDPLTEQLAREGGFNRYSFQCQALDSGGVRLHDSLGYEDDQGNYMPVVTVLNAKHPLRKAIETVRSSRILGLGNNSAA